MTDQAALETKVAQLEEQLQTLNRVRVVSVKGKGLRKYDGTEGSITFEEWKVEAQSALRKQDLDVEEAVNYLLSHLASTARDEIRYTRNTDRDTPDKVFGILEDAFGIRQSATQLLDAFFGYRQGEKETIRQYSHSLMKLLGKVQKKDNHRVSDPDVTLRDQFAEKVRDPQLRRELKKRIRQNGELTFKQIHEEAYDWEEDDQTLRKRVSVHEVEGAAALDDPIVEAARAVTHKPSDDGWQQKLVTMMEMQQQSMNKMTEAMTALTLHQSTAAEVRENNASYKPRYEPGSRPRLCFRCRAPDHIVRDCPEKKKDQQQQHQGKKTYNNSQQQQQQKSHTTSLNETSLQL